MIDHYEEIYKVPAELLDVVYAQMLEACPEKLYELISTKVQFLQWYVNIHIYIYIYNIILYYYYKILLFFFRNVHHHLDELQNCSEAASSSDDVFEITTQENHRFVLFLNKYYQKTKNIIMQIKPQG